MDRYKVLDLIGEGSFGRVFRGQERETGRIVALKLIPKVGHNERELRTLRSECKIQRKLDHPNIVKMLDAFETDNEVISVAEFVPGELFRLFDQYRHEVGGARRLPEIRVRELAGDLVSALHYLHSQRILHRDIKPQNILLDNEGKAKLCDFGFARNLGLNTFVLTSIKGTPLYMAPELIEEKPYDHTADLWSLGCILYELLVGQPPFSTNTLFQLIKKIRYECIQWPSHLSTEARSLLSGLLEKDSRRRLSWPDLPHHPFLKDVVRPEVLEAQETLTRCLTASEELAKEIQRQDKAKLLPGGSQTLILVAQKHELAKTQLAALGRGPSNHRRPPQHRRYSDVGQGGGHMLLGRHDPRLQTRRVSCLPTIDQAHYIAPSPPKEPVQFRTQPITPDLHTIAKPAPIRPAATTAEETEVILTQDSEKDTSTDSNETLKDSCANETVVEIEDKPIENAEWCEFLDCQLEEMLQDIDDGQGCLDSVNNQNYLSMLVGPLQNKQTDSVVLHKLCLLLSLPFVTQEPNSSAVTALIAAFKTKKLIFYITTATLVQIEKENEDNHDGLAALVCLLLRLVTQSSCLAAQFSQAMQLPAKQVTLISIFSKQNLKTPIIYDCLALISKLLVLETLSSEALSLMIPILETMLMHTEERVVARAMTLLGLVLKLDPDYRRKFTISLNTVCKGEGKTWSKHSIATGKYVLSILNDTGLI